MRNHEGAACIEFICLIVDFGLGSKCIKSAKQHGISGGTVLLGKGTAKSRLLDFIGLSDIRKEVVYMAGETKTVRHALAELNREYEFDKPNHGIAFVTTVCGVSGAKSMTCKNYEEESEVDETMYHIITTIVDRGKAEIVMNAASRAGSKGGTIINARGSGIHETSKLFAMEIEPEKEVVIILSESDQTKIIVKAIREDLHIDEPGKGIIYVQNTVQTYGIRK